MKTSITNDDNSISHELEIDEDDFLKIKVGSVLHFDDVLFFRKDVVQVLLDEKDRRIRELEEALTNAKEVLQWHLDKSIPFRSVDQSDFFNNTANAIEQSDAALNPPKP